MFPSQIYSANLGQMINMQLAQVGREEMQQMELQMATAQQMQAQQMMQAEAYQSMAGMAPYGQVMGMGPMMQMGGIPGPSMYQQMQQATPPGLSDPPPGQNWPQGTKVTQGGNIIEPAAGGTVKIFSSGASGPNDAAKLLFTVTNDKVMDKTGKEVFDLQKGGVLKLSDGSVISSSLDSSGDAHIHVICNNSRETYDYSATNYDASSNQDGSTYLQNQLGTSTITGNTYGVQISDTGDVNFYQLNQGQIMGKVTGQAWQVDPTKLQNFATSVIDTINNALETQTATDMNGNVVSGAAKNAGVHLNPSDYTSLIKGNDISGFIQKLNTDLNAKTGQNYNFSNLISDYKITNPNQLKDMVNNIQNDFLADQDRSGHSTHYDKAVNENIIGNLQNLVATNPLQSDWGADAATVDPTDKNFLVTPPEYNPPPSSPQYPYQLGNNMQAFMAGGGVNLPPQMAAYMSGGNGWQGQGPWAGQFAGGLYQSQTPFAQQVGQVPPMYQTYNGYSALASGIPGSNMRG
jgi:hypothetical protein